MPDQEKIALFIDGANLYATAKSLGFDIDYKKLLKEFQSRGLFGARDVHNIIPTPLAEKSTDCPGREDRRECPAKAIPRRPLAQVIAANNIAVMTKSRKLLPQFKGHLARSQTRIIWIVSYKQNLHWFRKQV